MSSETWHNFFFVPCVRACYLCIFCMRRPIDMSSSRKRVSNMLLLNLMCMRWVCRGRQRETIMTLFGHCSAMRRVAHASDNAYQISVCGMRYGIVLFVDHRISNSPAVVRHGRAGRQNALLLLLKSDMLLSRSARFDDMHTQRYCVALAMYHIEDLFDMYHPLADFVCKNQCVCGLVVAAWLLFFGYSLLTNCVTPATTISYISLN